MTTRGKLAHLIVIELTSSIREHLGIIREEVAKIRAEMMVDAEFPDGATNVVDAKFPDEGGR